MRLVIGTTNAGKIREIARVMHGFSITVETAANYEVPPVIEDGDTFAANACKKAIHYARYTGCVALADDSGLEVAALHGKPGVYSARYAGEHATDTMNNGKLLVELEKFSLPERGAQFRCVLAIATPGGRCETVEGICSGSIGFIPRGDQGFGYDPLFVLPDGRTMAELSIEEKNRISHRGQALQKLRLVLENFINETV
jgi:XTP/dITP diphosphohydrolase